MSGLQALPADAKRYSGVGIDQGHGTMPSGYEQSPDYGGARSPRLKGWGIAIAFLGIRCGRDLAAVFCKLKVRASKAGRPVARIGHMKDFILAIAVYEIAELNEVTHDGFPMGN